MYGGVSYLVPWYLVVLERLMLEAFGNEVIWGGDAMTSGWSPGGFCGLDA